MPGLLTKVIKHKKQQDKQKPTYESIVMGKIEKIFSFKKLADFQYYLCQTLTIIIITKVFTIIFFLIKKRL
jgi:hypothetical protein